MIIAQRLNMPVYGVNLPRHFVLAYADEYFTRPDRIQDSSVMFYINPFSKGTAFSRKEIEYFIRQLKLPSLPEFFQPCSNLDILIRVCNNLINSYNQLGYPDKVNEVKALQNILLPDDSE
jgi:regulator of sirC expression with transglutaminase-like and TPR domain